MNPEPDILDPSYSDDTVPHVRYDISSYGADFDVAGLVQRLKREDIIIPKFERLYVWNHAMASQFIESLLLGLPVPGIFFAKDPNTNLLIVIDGQQRLKSLQFFYDGFFPSGHGGKSKTFSLAAVQSQFMGLTYTSLSQTDRRILDDSIIHATIVKPNSPDDYTSIIHIFERINSRGLALTVQEMRNAVYRGPFLDLVEQLNTDANWRSIFGERHSRLRDQELIIQFLALYYHWQNYFRPMSEFLNRFVAHHQNADSAFLRKFELLFTKTIQIVYASIGDKAFRQNKVFNANIFDSIMVGIGERIQLGEEIKPSILRGTYEELLKMPEYQEATSSPLSIKTVKPRLEIAISSFSKV